MKELINRMLDNNLEQLRGLSVEGEIPISQELINELIHLYIEKGDTTVAESDTMTAPGKALDLKEILNNLDKKELQVEFKDKVAIVKINVKKYL